MGKEIDISKKSSASDNRLVKIESDLEVLMYSDYHTAELTLL